MLQWHKRCQIRWKPKEFLGWVGWIGQKLLQLKISRAVAHSAHRQCSSQLIGAQTAPVYVTRHARKPFAPDQFEIFPNYSTYFRSRILSKLQTRWQEGVYFKIQKSTPFLFLVLGKLWIHLAVVLISSVPGGKKVRFWPSMQSPSVMSWQLSVPVVITVAKWRTPRRVPVPPRLPEAAVKLHFTRFPVGRWRRSQFTSPRTDPMDSIQIEKAVF